MQKLWRVIRWVAEHLAIRTRDLNEGEKDAKPKPSTEVEVRWKF